jgi:beta-lactam-binding protein with PASTA domain
MDVPPVGPDGSSVKPPVAPNTVILQQPQPGARVDANTLVRLTIAR